MAQSNRCSSQDRRGILIKLFGHSGQHSKASNPAVEVEWPVRRESGPTCAVQPGSGVRLFLLAQRPECRRRKVESHIVVAHFPSAAVKDADEDQ